MRLRHHGIAVFFLIERTESAQNPKSSAMADPFSVPDIMHTKQVNFDGLGLHNNK
jgi:hypothetical protein